VKDLVIALTKAGSGHLRELAGSDAGIEILQRMKVELNKGGGDTKAQADLVDGALNERPSATKPKQEKTDEDALKRINDVINQDPHKSEYSKPLVPLKFPVEMNDPMLQRDGHVYWDPKLPTQSRTDVTAVQIGDSGKDTRLQYPLCFIRIGPLALKGSDAFLQSALWHEFQHYQTILSFRDADAKKSSLTKNLEDESVISAKTGADPYNDEAIAYGHQLADYFDGFSDDEAKMILKGLADRIKLASLVKSDVIDYIKNAVVSDSKRKARMQRLIDHLKDAKDRKNLSELRDAIK
jgi:hypothetical protein